MKLSNKTVEEDKVNGVMRVSLDNYGKDGLTERMMNYLLRYSNDSLDIKHFQERARLGTGMSPPAFFNRTEVLGEMSKYFDVKLF
mgnify:CR=1 FL=1